MSRVGLPRYYRDHLREVAEPFHVEPVPHAEINGAAEDDLEETAVPEWCQEFEPVEVDILVVKTCEVAVLIVHHQEQVGGARGGVAPGAVPPPAHALCGEA